MTEHGDATPAVDGREDAPGEGRATRSRWSTIGKVAAGVVIAAFTVMWLYAASPWSRREPPATLDHPEYAEQAQAVCEETLRPLDDLPFASEMHSPEERAVLLDQANDVVGELVVRLRTVEPVGAHDQELVDQWLADWDEYLRNREAYADTLRAGNDEPFRVTGYDGEPLDGSMNWFTQVNLMPACATPGDV